MDLWLWVHEEQRRLLEAGQLRLVELIDVVPSAVVDGDYSRAEAMIDEALTQVRGADRAWLELYFRHWRLQARVLHQGRARGNLQECVSLLELASRPENERCPQSVCATQDLVACYGLLDDPGFSQERMQASAQALERIDPTWPCFHCISHEYASAMMDSGRPAEALDFIEQQRGRHASSSAAREGPLGMNGVAAECHRRLGDHQAELREVEDWDVSLQGETGVLEKRVARALALMGCGDAEAGIEQLPEATEMDLYPAHYLDWARAAALAVRWGVLPNDAALATSLARFARQLEENGAMWRCASLRIIALELALERRAMAYASALRSSVERIAVDLRRPEGLFDELSRLAKPHPLGAEDPPPEPLSPERRLETLARRRDLEPDDERAVAEFLRGLLELDLHFDAEARAWAELERRPGASSVASVLGAILLTRGDHEALERLIARLPGDSALAPWLRARQLAQRGELAAAARSMERVLELAPDAKAALRFSAELERRLGRYAVALERYDALLEAGDEDDVEWDRMLVATLLGRFDLVRASAERIGLEVGPGSGPIEQDWGLCGIRVPAAREDQTVYARRTGPVTARVLSISPPESERQWYGDVVAFDATDLGLESQVNVFAWVETLEHGGYRSVAVDGVHPGDELLAVWASRVSGAIEVRSGENYLLELPESLPESDSEDATLGLYAYLAVSSDRTPEELHRDLESATRELGLKLAWLGLARLLERPDVEAEHLARLESLGIAPE